MTVLLINVGSYVNDDMMKALANIYGKNGVEELYHYLIFGGEEVYEDAEFEHVLTKKLKQNTYNCVVTTNFFPVIAKVCNAVGMKYIAWSYDSPINVRECKEMDFDTNFIFLFDRAESQRWHKKGHSRFFHMPLAVDTEKWDKFSSDVKYKGDVALLGKLYRSKIMIIKNGLNDDLCSYIDKITDAQLRTKDVYIVDDLISQPIMDEINRQYAIAGSPLRISKEQLSYTISEYVTYYDRLLLLEMFGRRFDMHLYTYDIGDREKEILKNVHIHDKLDYHTEMPRMFKSVKININSSIRSAQSGVNLRTVDVLGCKGFLLSNPQPELLEYFEDKKEIVLFRELEEAIDLTNYYLKHDDEREKIALAGYERVKKDFRYEDRFREMFKLAGIR
ncbi:CgeB family protein [Butyrivibrio fibrisolvens]|uniref:CgeB family protein n=1 Tax=Butyrivibrio fibrisolvens TaxID=831 RepID=UPI00040C33EF|nr:glycosyltransferase [Butyrivibrio fibrisolvens]